MITALSCFFTPTAAGWASTAPPAADCPGRRLERERLAAWRSQHSQGLVVANGQVGLTKARVPGSREGWP